MKMNKYFEKFIGDKIELNPQRITLLKNRKADIVDFIANDKFWQSLKAKIKVQGSWATYTMIKPLKDEDEVDLDLVLCVYKITDEYYKNPKKLLRELYDTFANSKFKENLLPFGENKRCITLEFTKDCQIDIVPLVDDEWIINGKSNNFEKSQPLELTQYINDTRKGTKLNFIAMLLKYIKSRFAMIETCLGKQPSIPSIALNVLLCEFYSQDLELADSKELDLSFFKVIQKLLDFMNSQVNIMDLKIYNPMNNEEDLARDWKKPERDIFKKHLEKIVPLLKKALYDSSLLEAINICKQIFGNEFPNLFEEDKNQAQEETHNQNSSKYPSRPASNVLVDNRKRFDWYPQYLANKKTLLDWNSKAVEDHFEFCKTFVYDGEKYIIRVEFPRNDFFPRAYLVNKSELHRKDWEYHIYQDGGICLGVGLDLLNAWEEHNFSIDFFLDGIVQGFVETLHYYLSYGTWLNGDWEHLHGGVFQYLLENPEISSFPEYCGLLQNQLEKANTLNQNFKKD